MHYCLHLFMKKMPTDEEIEKILGSFEEQEAPNNSPIVWDWYSIGGRYNNQLLTKTELMCNGARIKDLKNINDLGCYAFIDSDGKVVSRGYWDGQHFVADFDFDEKYRKTLEENKDGYLTVIDIHE